MEMIWVSIENQYVVSLWYKQGGQRYLNQK